MLLLAILVAFNLLSALAPGTEEISSAPQTTPWGKLCYMYLRGTFVDLKLNGAFFRRSEPHGRSSVLIHIQYQYKAVLILILILNR